MPIRLRSPAAFCLLPATVGNRGKTPIMRQYSIVEHGAPLKPRDLPNPDLQGNEVLVEVEKCGVCHTDLHLWDGYYELGGGKRFYLKDRGNVPPITPGHEIVGRVVAAGPDAPQIDPDKAWLVYPWIGCGTCASCAHGDEHLCATPQSLGVMEPGGYADHVLVRDHRYLVDFEGLDSGFAATLACSGLTAFGALKKAAVAGDDWLVIIGAGGLGLSAIEIAKAQGVQHIAVVDLDARKLAAAKSAGASAVIKGGQYDKAAAELGALTGGGPSAVIDFVGASQTAHLGTAILPRGGRYIIVGLFGGELKLALPFLPIRAISIAGSFTGNLQDLQELVAMAQAGRVSPIHISERQMTDVNAVLSDLRDGRFVGRAVLTR